MTRRPYPQPGALYGSLRAVRAVKKEITEQYGAVHVAEFWELTCIRCGHEVQLQTRVVIHGDVTCNRSACIEVAAAMPELADVEFGRLTGDAIAAFAAEQAAEDER